mgnify:CR=1 FL=1
MNKILARKFVAAGEVLMHEGDEAARAFFIENGSIEIYRTDSDGKDRRVSVAGAGEIIGELAFFADPKTRTASARALEGSTVVTLSQRDIERYIDTMDKPAKALYKIMLKRLLHMNDVMSKNFYNPQHLNEAGQVTISNIREQIKDSDLRTEFDREVVAEFNTFVSKLRTFERKRQAEEGL